PFSHPLLVNVVPFTVDFGLQLSAPANTVSQGEIHAGAFLRSTGDPIFGGTYRFTEISASPLLTLSFDTSLTADFVTFSASFAGTATVLVELLDPSGLTVASGAVDVFVAP